MTATLVKTENASRVTYTGVGTMVGYSLVIQKKAAQVEITQIVPTALGQGQTWQSIVADLVSRLT